MISLILINNLIFRLIKAPLFLMISLFLKVLLICITIGLISQTFWFSYILFLIFIGGILILLIYLISLISNDKLNLKRIKTLNLVFFLFIVLLLIFFKSPFFTNSLDLHNFSFLKHIFQENSLNLNKLYSFPTNIINILLINFLFFILVITLKIIDFFYGPFRANL